MAIKDDMEDVQEAVINELITENGITNTLADGQVTETKILNSAVTTPKIANGAVTAAKLGSDVSLTPADGSVTPAKLSQAYLPLTGGTIGGALNVGQSANDFAVTITNNSNDAQGLQVRTSDNDSGQYILDLQSSTSATGTNYGSKFVVEKGGNAGIGTSSPVTALDVRGEISVDYNANYGLRFYNENRNNWSSIGNTTAAGDSSANLVFKTGIGEAMRIQANGTVILSNVPTSAPSTSGAIWSDNGTLKIVT